jgi:hypothetical protein
MGRNIIKNSAVGRICGARGNEWKELRGNYCSKMALFSPVK